MDAAMGSQVFDRVGKDFLTQLCQRRHFEPIDSPAERHGSWEWTFRKRVDGLDRFVLVAFTSLPPAVPDSDWYAVEVWAGAEKENRYTRKPVFDFHASLQESYRQRLRSALEEPLARAMSIADSLTSRDLDEAYAGPRSTEPRQNTRSSSASPPEGA